MIKLNGSIVNVSFFADNTQHFELGNSYGNEYKIEWTYENDTELVTLIFMVGHIREKDVKASITLNMWYIPNARQDRVKGDNEVFTLKYFARVINSLHFKKVFTLDAHSNVSLGLFDHIVNLSPNDYVDKAINRIFNDPLNTSIGHQNELVIFYPDDGSAKRYKDMPALANYDAVYGKKIRDWKTRQIVNMTVVSDSTKPVSEIIGGKKILVIDDIISSGNTMHKGTKILKDLGAKDVYAFASHVENPDRDGYGEGLKAAFADGCIKKVYTTNSLYKGGNENIIIIND